MIYYLTKEGKEELEKRIFDLGERLPLIDYKRNPNYRTIIVIQIATFKEVLKNSFVLPEYNSWEDVEIYPPDNEGQDAKTLRDINGVIIKRTMHG